MPTIVYPKDFKEVPWKNGQGITREIYRLPLDSDASDFNFRLSMAAVNQSGPFSLYPGKDRFLMLLEGKGFRLTFDDKSQVSLTAPFDSTEFEGEDVIQCELIDRACSDFNVMTDRNWGKSVITLSPLKFNQVKKYTPKSDTYLFLYQTSPKLIILSSGESFDLKASENLMVVEITVTKNHLH